jgi:hypothetical protein
MWAVRQNLTRLAGAWLLCQALSLTFVPISLYAGASTPAVEQTCTCAHNDGQECPMHHTKSKSASTCSCRSTSDAPSALLPLFGPAAILVPPASIIAATVSSGVPTIPQAVAFGSSVNPDPPPPQA